MNIPGNISEYAQKVGLDWIGTGGGLDYIYFNRDGEDVILIDAGDAGSPEDIEDPCIVAVFADEDWQDLREEIKFPNCREALDYMAARKSEKKEG